MPPIPQIIAFVCVGWYVFIGLVCLVGCVQISRHYARPPAQAISPTLPPHDVPHVTIIRPCKGREPNLYECLASAVEQDYPKEKLTVYFCVASRDDVACSVIERVLSKYSSHDVRLMVEEEDPALASNAPDAQKLGPNPKIRNMSRAYKEAKGDLVWILDCPYKFVHHLPVAVDVPAEEAFDDMPAAAAPRSALSSARPMSGDASKSLTPGFGGRLDEAFLSSAHAKMYVAINTVAVAPCICGKSSMFRRSHLNALTNEDHSTETKFGGGIDYFSENICEDHLIGDLLWKAKIPETMPTAARSWRNHGLVYGDLALQPISDMRLKSYIARRVRWLRVRKFTVPMATLVEPGTESFLCSLIGAYGLTTLEATRDYVGSSWQAMLTLWLLSILGWVVADWTIYCLLQSGKTVELSTGDVALPPFLRTQRNRRPFLTWLASWLGREVLTFPIWSWAIWGGMTVVWRDKKLWVGLDMKVHEIDGGMHIEQTQPLLSGSHSSNAAVQVLSLVSARDGVKARKD